MSHASAPFLVSVEFGIETKLKPQLPDGSWCLSQNQADVYGRSIKPWR